MHKTKAAIAGIIALFAVASASAQQFPTVPDHTVIGRIGVGGQSGPSQAIPFTSFLPNLVGTQLANKVFAGPTSGVAALPAFRSLVGADIPWSFLSQDCTATSGGVITCLKTNNVAFGTAAVQNTGTSGATIPFLNGVNIFSGSSNLFAGIVIYGDATAGINFQGDVAGIGQITGINTLNNSFNPLVLISGVSGGLKIQTSGGVSAGGAADPGTNFFASLAGYKIASKLAWSATAPNISSGFCTTPSISNNNGTAAFTVTIGSACAAATGVLTMPAASIGWACNFRNVTNNATSAPSQTASSTTSVNVTNYVRTTGVAGNWTASDVIVADCTAY